VGAAPFEALARTYPGAGVAMLTAAVEALATVAATMTIGALLWQVLAQQRAKGRPLAPEGMGLTLLRVAAATWLLSALPLPRLKGVDTSGLSPAQLTDSTDVTYLFSSAYAPGASVIHVLGALAVFLIAQFTRRGEWFVAGLWAAAWAIVAPVAVGHVLVGPNHDFASDVAYFQALTQAAGLGLILFTATTVSLVQFPTPVLLRRLFLTATALLVLTVAPEPLITYVKLAGSSLTTTPTGQLLLAKWASAAVVAVALIIGPRLAR